MPEPTASTTARCARGLVVADSEESRRAITRALAKAPGWRIFTHTASTVDEAAACLGRDRYDLVIAEARVHHASGIDLLANVARNRASALRVLVAPHDPRTGLPPGIGRARVDALVRAPLEEAALCVLVTRLLARDVPASARPAPVGDTLRALDLEAQRLRVRLGLGTLAPDAYARLSAELDARRARLLGR